MKHPSCLKRNLDTTPELFSISDIVLTQSFFGVSNSDKYTSEISLFKALRRYSFISQSDLTFFETDTSLKSLSDHNIIGMDAGGLVIQLSGPLKDEMGFSKTTKKEQKYIGLFDANKEKFLKSDLGQGFEVLEYDMMYRKVHFKTYVDSKR